MKAIKAFIPYACGPALFQWCRNAVKKPAKVQDVLSHFMASDPHPNEWTSHGFVDALEEGSLVHDLDGLAYMMRFKFNQRILPAVVRDTEIAKRLTELRERKGDVETKQEYAQIREDVENALLPKAFIRPSYIPVLIYQDKILFCTTSARRVQEMLGHLVRMMEVRKIECEIRGWETENSMQWFMTAAAKDEELIGRHGEIAFLAGDAMVLKGLDKRAVRFKDRDISSHEVQALFNDKSEDYYPTEIRLRALDTENEDIAVFTVASTWTFKGIKMGESLEFKSLEDSHATTWYYARELGNIFDSVLSILVDKGAPASEDEEL